MMNERLKLRALDGEDLAVISACLQDAAVPLSEISYLPSQRRLAFVASRYRWENDGADHDPKGGAEGTVQERINCGVVFDRVTRVRTRHVDLSDRSQTFDLLAVDIRDGDIILVLGGGGEVRLEVERIVCHLQDIGEPWPTQWRPGHPDQNGD
jgi:hypothetical protein